MLGLLRNVAKAQRPAVVAALRQGMPLAHAIVVPQLMAAAIKYQSGPQD